MPQPNLDTVIFDLGKVVLNWEPERAFEAVLPAADVPAFMAEVSFHDWNVRLDAGDSIDAAERDLAARFPQHAAVIRAYRQHFERTLTGMVSGTSAIIAELAKAGVRLVALTNWSAELFPYARKRFGILDRFEGIVVSGTERIVKPDPAIFRLLLDRFEIDAAAAVFTDDSMINCDAANDLGITALHFTDAGTLRGRLVDLGLLDPRTHPAEPVFHVALRNEWEHAKETGNYPWSSRGVSYEREGFVHGSFGHQLPGVLDRFYSDLEPDQLVILEIDPARSGPIVTEDVGAGAEFPHVYSALVPTAVRVESDVPG